MIYSPDLVELCERYCESFPFGLRQGSSPTEWTKGVKCFWIDLGKGRQYKVKVRGSIRGEPDQKRHSDHEPREFMIDVVWEDMADGHRCLQLAMEYEYDKDPDEQELDFRKILHVKAYGKVFISEASKATDLEGVRNTVDHLCGLIKGCVITQQPPDEYLLICHRDGPGTCTTINGVLVPPVGKHKELPPQRRDVPR